MSNPDPWTHVEDAGCVCVGCQVTDRFWAGFREEVFARMDYEAVRALLAEAGSGLAGGYWYCQECGRPQAGDSSWPSKVLRCVACGPGEGFAPCPATHARGAGACVLCRGVGWIEEMV